MHIGVLLRAIEDKEHHQVHIAALCARMLQEENVNWKKINEFIIKRWKPSARQRIMEIAWTIHDIEIRYPE